MPDRRRNAPHEYQRRRIAEARDAMRATIGDGLRQRLETPQHLPLNIVSLLAKITDQDEQQLCWPRVLRGSLEQH
jgi:hypothetical protein